MASIFFGWLVDSTAQDDRFRSRACSIREYIRFAFIARVFFFGVLQSVHLTVRTADAHIPRLESSQTVRLSRLGVVCFRCRLLSWSSAFVVVCKRGLEWRDPPSFTEIFAVCTALLLTCFSFLSVTVLSRIDLDLTHLVQ